MTLNEFAQAFHAAFTLHQSKGGYALSLIHI